MTRAELKAKGLSDDRPNVDCAGRIVSHGMLDRRTKEGKRLFETVYRPLLRAIAKAVT